MSATTVSWYRYFFFSFSDTERENCIGIRRCEFTTRWVTFRLHFMFIISTSIVKNYLLQSPVYLSICNRLIRLSLRWKSLGKRNLDEGRDEDKADNCTQKTAQDANLEGPVFEASSDRSYVFLRYYSYRVSWRIDVYRSLRRRTTRNDDRTAFLAWMRRLVCGMLHHDTASTGQRPLTGANKRSTCPHRGSS